MSTYVIDPAGAPVRHVHVLAPRVLGASGQGRAVQEVRLCDRAVASLTRRQVGAQDHDVAGGLGAPQACRSCARAWAQRTGADADALDTPSLLADLQEVTA